MPYPNEHSARIEDPDKFIPDSFRSKEIADGIRIILGKYRSDPDGSMHIQAYRFDKNKFTPEEAKKWLTKHNIKYIIFEKAKEVLTDMAWKLNNKGLEKAKSLIKRGMITDASWDASLVDKALGPNGDDFDRYSEWHLAVDPDADPKTKQAYGYPFGDGERLYVSALRAIIAAASGARGATPRPDIAKAASDLLESIKEKEEKKAKEYSFKNPDLAELVKENDNELPEYLPLLPDFPVYVKGEKMNFAEINRQIVENFKKDPRHIPLDLQHQSEIEGHPAPAVGWVEDHENGIIIKDGLLWVKPTWTDPQIVEDIKNKKWRYLSAVIVPNNKDLHGNYTGWMLKSIAITNRPAIPFAKILSESIKEKKEVLMTGTIQKIADVLGIDISGLTNDTDIENAILKAIDDLKEKAAKAATAETPTEAPAEEKVQAKASDSELIMLKEKIGLLEKQLSEMKARETRMRIEGIIDTSGKVDPADRERIIQFGLKYGEEELRNYLKMIPSPVAPSIMTFNETEEIETPPRDPDDVITLAKKEQAKALKEGKTISLIEATDIVNKRWNLSEVKR